MVSVQAGIYEIFNTVNGKRYIGSSKNIVARWKDHRTHLRNDKHHSARLQNAWNKYGEQVFQFRVILFCGPAKEVLHFYEQRCFDSYKPEYNISPTAGKPLGVKHTPESVAKQANAVRGQTRTPEQCARISAGHMGKKLSDAGRANLSAALTGLVRTFEHCTKISEALLGRKFSEARKAGLRKPKSIVGAARIALANRRRAAYKRLMAAQGALA